MCLQSNMEVTCLGSALRQIIPRIVGNVRIRCFLSKYLKRFSKGLSSWWELVKPLVEFKWDVILTRFFF